MKDHYDLLLLAYGVVDVCSPEGSRRAEGHADGIQRRASWHHVCRALAGLNPIEKQRQRL
jgi:hypothetical protein